MGSFLGHLVPGTFLALFGLWWMYSMLRRYFIAKKFHHNGAEAYRSTASFPCFMCYGKVPLEGYVKIIAVIIGIIGETVTAVDHGHWLYIGNAQHITMFAFFGFFGILDILYARKCTALPPDLDYAVAFLGLASEGFLFFNHLHGRTPMDIQVHMSLFYAIVANAAAVAFEACYRKNVVAALSRSYFTFLQGTWLIQIGLILYPPFSFMRKWNENSHEQMMITALMFSWHAAAHIILVLCMACLAKRKVESMDCNVEEEFSLWADDSTVLYSKLNDKEQQWTALYVDNEEDARKQRTKHIERSVMHLLESDSEVL